MSLILLLDDAGGGGGGSEPHPLSDEALGLVGASGWLMDGSVAGGFFTDSAGTILAATSDSDPLGNISDYSGLNNPWLQASSNNKPIYTVRNGIQGMRGGTISGQPKFAEATAPFSAKHYRFQVYRILIPNDGDVHVLGKYSGGNAVVLYLNDGTGGRAYDNGTEIITAGSSITTAGIMKYARTSTGANAASMTFYDTAGAERCTGTATHGSTYGSVTWYIGGDPAFERQNIEIYFDMCVDFAGAGDLTNDQINTILAYMETIAGAVA